MDNDARHDCATLGPDRAVALSDCAASSGSRLPTSFMGVTSLFIFDDINPLRLYVNPLRFYVNPLCFYVSPLCLRQPFVNCSAACHLMIL